MGVHKLRRLRLYECPVMNEHIQKIVDLRRYLTLMEGDIPAEGQVALQNMEKNSNPWGMGFDKRAEWAKGLDVPVFAKVLTKTQNIFFMSAAPVHLMTATKDRPGYGKNS